MSKTQFYPVAVILKNNEPHLYHQGAANGSLAHVITKAKALRETYKANARPATDDNAFYAVVGVQGFDAAILSTDIQNNPGLTLSIVGRFETNLANALRIH